MAFELLCMAVIGVLFGAALAFGGYRLFLILLPIWGFFFGFFLGAQTIQVIFNESFLVTVTSWVTGVVVGLLFAVLSYLFYLFAVALLSGSFGYALTVGLLTTIGLDFGFLVWLSGLVVGVILAVVVLRFNIQKYAIIAITAIGGAGAIIFTSLAVFGQLTLAQLAGMGRPVLNAVTSSFWWLLLFLLVAIGGIVFQIRANRNFEVETYNRFSTM